MISKIKKPVSIILTVLMVVSLFTIVPFTASAETIGPIGGDPATMSFICEAVIKGELDTLFDANDEYDTLQETIEAAESGDTIVVVNPINNLSQITIPAGKELTLDLNGYTVKGDAGLFKVPAGASLTVVNGTLESVAADNKYAIYVASKDENGGTFVLGEDATIKTTGTDSGAVRGYAGADITINGTVDAATYGVVVTKSAKLTVNSTAVINGSENAIASNGNSGNGGYEIVINGGTIGSADTNTAIYHQNAGSLTINGGSVTGKTAVYVKSGTTTINGGTFLSTKNPGENYSYNGNGTTSTGDTIVVDNCRYPGGAPAIEIKGGTFTVTDTANADPVASYKTGSGIGFRPITGFVSGGTFNKAVTANLIAPDAELNNNGDGTYGVISHNWDLDNPVWDADVTEDIPYYSYYAYVTFTCADPGCNATYKVKADGGMIEEKDADCVEGGYMFVICSVDFGGKTFSHQYNLEEPSEPDPDNHVFSQHHPAVAATYNAPGNIEYWECASCGKLFADENMTQEITAENVVIPMLTGAVAQVGETKYGTFAEAVAAANGSLIKILAKDATPYVMSVGQTIVTDNYTKITIVAPEGVYAINRAYSFDDKAYTFTVVDAVASSTTDGVTTYYATVNSAFSAAPSQWGATPSTKTTITLLKDQTENAVTAGSRTSGKNIEFDLNGKTLTLNGNSNVLFGVRGPTVLTVKNGTIEFDTGFANGNGFTVENGANLTINNNVTVQANDTCGAVSVFNGTLTTAGALSSEDSYTISTNGGTSDSYTINVTGGSVTASDGIAIYQPGKNGTLNISGGTITGKTGVYVKAGTTTISGGSIVGNGAKADYSPAQNGANPTGDAIVVDSCGYPGGAPTVEISGGTFTSANGKMIGDYKTDTVENLASVTSTNNTLTLPTGLKWVETDTPGVYEVGQKLFVGHTVTLGGNIGVNFFINPTAADFANANNASVKFTWDGGKYSEEVNLLTLGIDEDTGYYKASVEVVAAQMAHKIHAVVYLNGETLAETDDYSVQDYAEAVYAAPAKYTTADKADALQTLAKAMLNYGAQAQNIFASSLNDTTPAPANTTVGNNGYSAVTVGDVQNAILGSASNLENVAEQLNAKYYTNSLIYLQNNTLRVYFTPKTYPSTMPNAGAYTGNLSNYYYYKDVEGIAAAELDEQKVFTVGNVTFKYSALNYVVNVLNSGDKMDSAQKNLAKSLFLYNQAANAYF